MIEKLLGIPVPICSLAVEITQSLKIPMLLLLGGNALYVGPFRMIELPLLELTCVLMTSGTLRGKSGCSSLLVCW